MLKTFTEIPRFFTVTNFSIKNKNDINMLMCIFFVIFLQK
uniref:Uncharacterized protein n=1 Tax=viral metagenome TaxID=1070528 RepID=A0A6C0LFX5_9ZZZZ